MKLTTLIAVPFLLMIQGFTLVITKKNGEETRIETENIERITFIEEAAVVPPVDPAKTKLQAPQVKATPRADGEMVISWNSVANAVFYKHQLDDEATVMDKATEITLTNLSAGTHTYKVIAVPVGSSEYAESDPGTVTFSIENGLAVSAGDVTSASVQALITATGTEPYCVGIMPRGEYKTDAEIIAWINGNSASQKKELTGLGGREQEVFFSGLNPNTNYVIAAFDKNATDKVSKYYVCTDIDLTPGATGSVFPFGVSEKGGFYDVDKVGDNSGYGVGWTKDNEFCWACSCAGVIAWWLDDYKSKTGKDYPVTPGVIPAKSACYSTPVMDVFVNAHNNQAGSPYSIEWFFSGTEGNAWVNDEAWQYIESYPYWKGGFMGMSKSEMRTYLVRNAHAHYSFDKPEDYYYAFNVGTSLKKEYTEAEASKVFAEVVLNALKQGPAYLGFGGHHALSCWGAEYKILADGTPQITHLYIGENDNRPENTRNGLEKCQVAFSYDALLGRQKICARMSTPIRGFDTITLLTVLRGWEANK